MNIWTKHLLQNLTDDPSEELGAPEPINVLDHMLNESLLQQFSSSPFTNISNSNEQQQQTAVVADYSRYWNLLHLVLMTFLAVYAVYKERIVMGEELFSSLLSQEAHIYSSAYTPFFWYFALLELGLLSARFLLQKDQMTSNNSILATIASQLPHPYNQVINLFMRYRLIGTLFIQDVFILVFVTGLSIICMK
ncbi:hypothetical protein G6F35_014691 [Rhizopus arrhizus]|nr:hypothetical protein G6F35_014691 [Rhizopus arrhizus]KAG1272207.1 hypothetical protein G6F66_013389 [Rhizopus arrhizus]